MNLIVNLLSDQTIPNLQFIKEFFKKGEDELLFISTQKTIKDGIKDSLLKALELSEDEKIHTIEVSPYSPQNIQNELNNINYDNYDDILVNVTGGTKVMSLATQDYFKNKGSKIYYIPGQESKYLKIFPVRKETVLYFEKNISLKEYLYAYGFEIGKGTSLSNKSFEYTKRFFKWFVEDKSPQEHYVISQIQEYRNKGIEIDKIDGLKLLLSNCCFEHENKDRLSKYEVRYLTGDWFEEYVYYSIDELLDLKSDLQTGYVLKKGNIENEFDVIFLYDNRLYIIECKTSLKNQNKPSLTNDTIYKSASLIKQMGLFGKSYIFTLNTEQEINKTAKERATLLKLQIVCREKIEDTNFVKDVLGINE